MVVAEVLTGISLVKASVDFIKSNISTCQDISQIAGQIDDLFRGEKEVQALRNKKSGTGLGDQFGVDTVAKEIIDARLAAEQLQEVATMVDMRFGHGTWAGIVAERAKRIQEAKEAAAAARREAVKKQNEELQSKLSKLDTTYVGEFDTRVQSQSLAAKEAYRKAVEDNDVDAMYEAQQNISRIAMEEARLNHLKTRREEQVKQNEATQQPQAQQTQAPRPKPDAKAEDWAKKNTWFGQDQPMTYAPFGLHKQ